VYRERRKTGVGQGLQPPPNFLSGGPTAGRSPLSTPTQTSTIVTQPRGVREAKAGRYQADVFQTTPLSSHASALPAATYTLKLVSSVARASSPSANRVRAPSGRRA